MGNTTAHSSLSKLQKWLTFEKHIWILGGGVLFVPPGLVLSSILFLAVIFTPILIWHLTKAGWYKSIAVFFAVVVMPYLALQFIHIENTMVSYLLSTVPLVAFFTYTWILSQMITSHLHEMETVRMWEWTARKNE